MTTFLREIIRDAVKRIPDSHLPAALRPAPPAPVPMLPEADLAAFEVSLDSEAPPPEREAVTSDRPPLRPATPAVPEPAGASPPARAIVATAPPIPKLAPTIGRNPAAANLPGDEDRPTSDKGVGESGPSSTLILPASGVEECGPPDAPSGVELRPPSGTSSVIPAVSSASLQITVATGPRQSTKESQPGVQLAPADTREIAWEVISVPDIVPSRITPTPWRAPERAPSAQPDRPPPPPGEALASPAVSPPRVVTAPTTPPSKEASELVIRSEAEADFIIEQLDIRVVNEVACPAPAPPPSRSAAREPRKAGAWTTAARYYLGRL